MGTIATITATQFPAQGPWLGRRVQVVFHHDTTQGCWGVCVRDDVEAPWQAIFQLDDGRVVLEGECQFSLHEEDTP